MPYLCDPTDAPESSREPVAICGMACRLPGQIDSPSKLWDLLLKKGSVQTPRVPKSRFNIDAHYHKNLDRPGSFNVIGGYFLDGPADAFDPTFFNMTPIEAMWLDPQQRRILEVCYEAFESAGLSLDAISGTNCAVYVGCFTADYQQMCHRETDFRHNYVATGVDPGIISNRVGNTFNLNGPSFTINTACSSSISALHYACSALRARDCDAALVGGVNLVLTVDQHMNTAKLGILSPTSTCHTFDESADGYGRAEGAGALYLKRLADAIRDGDVIRSVIRSSAVNTNGKVPGMGITHPSKKGQEMVVRKAYERAKLDPNDTAYFECHGTGTPVGDPIEVHAVSNAMNDSRSPEKPLVLGAVKANIGHSEAASGVFAVMKAALMTEQGVIPGTCGLKNVNHEILETEWNVQVSRDTKLWPAGFRSKRASVSSFGYGGTNGHVILEDVQSLHPEYRHGQLKELADYDHSATRPFLIVQSAHDSTTLRRNIVTHQNVVEKFYLVDFAHTLNTKRSHLAYRGYTVASEGSEAEAMDPFNFQSGPTRRQSPQLAFMFTGQGAAWAGVAVEALQHFPVFANTIRRLDQVLKTVEHPAVFSIEKELLAPPENSKIGHPKYSQPILVALEIALVDLLASWGIQPTATFGHSAGEYAAAYAAGLASASEIIIAAYYRGYCLDKCAPSGGTMLAVGKGPSEISQILPNVGNDIAIACENSPASVTLSGPVKAIREAKEVLDSQSIFARELTTGMAYHSPAMEPVAKPMRELVSSALSKLDPAWMQWRRPQCLMISSVNNAPLKAEQVTPDYWAQNLTGRVRFSEALATLAKFPGNDKIACFVELGPHSALAGPFKQICDAEQLKGMTHIPTFVRKQDSAARLLKTAGQLFVENYPVNLSRVNEVTGPSTDKKRIQPLTLVDLPPYQWNYEKQYWAESRFSSQQRNFTHARHDILGRRIPGLSESGFVWANRLRNKDVPWMQDHKLGDDIIFPAAGHLAVAIEATRQMCEIRDIPMNGVQLRDVDISSALVIPADEDGIQIQVRLSQTSVAANGQPTFQFVVESMSDDSCKIHSTGSVVPLPEAEAGEGAAKCPVDASKLTRRQSGRGWYEALRTVGFEYGPSFNGLQSIRTNGKTRDAAASVVIRASSSLMEDESRYILHPSTVDACLQLIIISIHRGVSQNMPWGVVPVKIQEASLWPLDGGEPNLGQAVAWTDEQDGRYFNTHTKLMSSNGKLVMDVQSLRCVTYEAAIPPNTGTVLKPQPYSYTAWKTDLDACDIHQLNLSEQADAIFQLVDLINHKRSPSNAVYLGFANADTLTKLANASPNASSITVMSCANQDHSESSEEVTDGRITVNRLSASYMQAQEYELCPQDLVIADLSVFGKSEDVQQTFDIVKTLLRENGDMIIHAAAPASSGVRQALKDTKTAFSEANINESTLFHAKAAEDVSPSPLVFTVGCVDGAEASTKELVTELQNRGIVVKVSELSDCEPSVDRHVLIHDPAGTVLTAPDEKTWKALQNVLCAGAPIIWLTSGVNESVNPDGGAVQGFLRVLRSEDAIAKLALLDVDQSQSTQSVAAALEYMARKRLSSEGEIERELWLHNNALHCGRIVPAEKANNVFAVERQQESAIHLSPDLALQGTVQDSNVVFSDAKDIGRIQLGSSEVEIRVTHEQLQDLRSGPVLVAGEVVKKGSAAPEDILGKHALCFSANNFNTLIRRSWNQCLLCDGSEAAKLIAELPGLSKAVNALQSASPGQHVYILPTDAETQRAFKLASKVLGLQLSVVEQDFVPSELIRSIRAAKDHSKTFVVSHDFTPSAQEIWRFITPQSYFIINEGSVDVAPDVLPFSRGAQFRSTSICNLWKTGAPELGWVLQQAAEIARKVCFGQAATTPSTVSVSSIGDSLSQSPLPSVMTYGYGIDEIQFKASPPHVTFASNACYLLVGCLGGLGRSLTAWMTERGARDFAFISRSGADRPEAADLVELLRHNGVTAEVFRGDASKTSDVQNAVQTITKTRPIRGVVHAAMVLNDGVFGPTLSLDQFNSVMTPKVSGAKALYEALRECDLDFFVMTSSISAALGQPGQSAYSAANSFLDAFACHLRTQAVPAVSLALPMILGVGVVAESDNLEEHIRKRGMYGVDEDEMLRGFEAAMWRPLNKGGLPIPPVLNMGLEAARLATSVSSTDISNVYWWNDSRLSNVRAALAMVNADNGSSQAGGKGSIVAEAKSLAASGGDKAALLLIAQHLMQKCSTILLQPFESFELEGPSVASYGLDSMIGTEMRSWLFKEFGLTIAFQELLSTSLTFSGLSKLVLGALQDKALAHV